MTRKLFISVVDDNLSVRESLTELLRGFGFYAEAFPSAETYLASGALSQTECLILDMAIPGMGGLGLRRELKRRGLDTPIIIMTADMGDEERRQIMTKYEVVACLVKPFETAPLLEAISAVVLLLATRASLRKS